MTGCWIFFERKEKKTKLNASRAFVRLLFSLIDKRVMCGAVVLAMDKIVLCGDAFSSLPRRHTSFQFSFCPFHCSSQYTHIDFYHSFYTRRARYYYGRCCGCCCCFSFSTFGESPHVWVCLCVSGGGGFGGPDIHRPTTTKGNRLTHRQWEWCTIPLLLFRFLLSSVSYADGVCKVIFLSFLVALILLLLLLFIVADWWVRERASARVCAHAQFNCLQRKSVRDYV